MFLFFKYSWNVHRRKKIQMLLFINFFPTKCWGFHQSRKLCTVQVYKPTLSAHPLTSPDFSENETLALDLDILGHHMDTWSPQSLVWHRLLPIFSYPALIFEINISNCYQTFPKLISFMYSSFIRFTHRYSGDILPAKSFNVLFYFITYSSQH